MCSRKTSLLLETPIQKKLKPISATDNELQDLYWEYTEQDKNPKAQTIGFWQQCDTAHHLQLSERYREHRAGREPDPVMWLERNPGRSKKINDWHAMDTQQMHSENHKTKVKRALRIVTLQVLTNDEARGCAREQVEKGVEGSQPRLIWQFQDDKGWTNFVPDHCRLLNRALLDGTNCGLVHFWQNPGIPSKLSKSKITVDMATLVQKVEKKDNVCATKNVRAVKIQVQEGHENQRQEPER